MAELWELICHHTYRGIPGVVVDLSPRAASHGQAFGLDDSDFLADGSATGSGPCASTSKAAEYAFLPRRPLAVDHWRQG